MSFNNLPSDIIGIIFSFIPINENINRICQKWNFLNDNYIICQRILTTYGNKSMQKYINSDSPYNKNINIFKILLSYNIMDIYIIEKKIIINDRLEIANFLKILTLENLKYSTLKFKTRIFTEIFLKNNFLDTDKEKLYNELFTENNINIYFYIEKCILNINCKKKIYNLLCKIINIFNNNLQLYKFLKHINNCNKWFLIYYIENKKINFDLNIIDFCDREQMIILNKMYKNKFENLINNKNNISYITTIKLANFYIINKINYIFPKNALIKLIIDESIFLFSFINKYKKKNLINLIENLIIKRQINPDNIIFHKKLEAFLDINYFDIIFINIIKRNNSFFRNLKIFTYAIEKTNIITSKNFTYIIDYILNFYSYIYLLKFFEINNEFLINMFKKNNFLEKIYQEIISYQDFEFEKYNFLLIIYNFLIVNKLEDKKFFEIIDERIIKEFSLPVYYELDYDLYINCLKYITNNKNINFYNHILKIYKSLGNDKNYIKDKLKEDYF